MCFVNYESSQVSERDLKILIARMIYRLPDFEVTGIHDGQFNQSTDLCRTNILYINCIFFWIFGQLEEVSVLMHYIDLKIFVLLQTN